MDKPTNEDRLRLLRFVCSFAWADLEVTDSEKTYVRELMSKMGLSPEEQAEVDRWLVEPPPAEDIDPFEIPAEHRQAVLAAVAGMIRADGKVSQGELDCFMILESLIGALEETQTVEVDRS